MIQLTKYGFRTSYDIDDMLYDDATWLAEQTTGSLKSFREIVERFELTDRYVGEFWKIVAQKRAERTKEIKKLEREREILDGATRGKRDYHVMVDEKEYTLTKEEFEALKMYKTPEKISNCCGADVTESNDFTARCYDCKENCGIIHVF